MPHAIAAPIALAAVPVVLTLPVEDWRSDLVRNVAETDPAHPDPPPRPLEISLPVAATAALSEKAVTALPRWDVTGVVGDTPGAALRLMRPSRLVRFRDDVTVCVERDGPATLMRARSASRVERGDLGQNPRNLRQSLPAIRTRDDSATPDDPD